jgi:hypothetical protein
MLTKIKTIGLRVGRALVSRTAFRSVLIFLALINLLQAIDFGFKGELRPLMNSVNWIIWMGVVYIFSLLEEKMEKMISSQRIYIESLETRQETAKDIINAQGDYIKELEEKTDA